MSHLQIVYTVIGCLVGLAGLYRFVWPGVVAVARFFRTFAALIDLLFTGRPAGFDEVSGEPQAEVLPLPKALARFRGDLDTQITDLRALTETVSDLTSVVTEMADQRADIMQLAEVVGQLKTTQGEHGEAIAALLASTWHAGAEANLRAAEKANADVIDVEGKETKP